MMSYDSLPLIYTYIKRHSPFQLNVFFAQNQTIFIVILCFLHYTDFKNNFNVLKFLNHTFLPL